LRLASINLQVEGKLKDTAELLGKEAQLLAAERDKVRPWHPIQGLGFRVSGFGFRV